MKRKPRVLVIGTGGTIGAKLIKGAWKYGELTVQELVRDTARVKNHFDITITNLFRADSSDLTPESWLTLANTIYYSMKDYDGIVVTMGTDTLAYVATAISFLIQDNNIPIVFTGSQMDPAQLNTDAKINLRDAITVAGQADIAETMIVFNGSILRATRTKEANASELNSFMSYETTTPQLGEIQQFISLNPPYRKRSKSRPVLYTKLENDVVLIRVYPGFDKKRIISIIDYGAKGIVLGGFGLGNIPLIDSTMKEAIDYAGKRNVPIVVASETFLGKHWQQLYEVELGPRLRGLRLIPVYDMLPATAYVKLMWVLGQTKDYSEVKRMMQTEYAGEITALGSGKKKGGVGKWA